MSASMDMPGNDVSPKMLLCPAADKRYLFIGGRLFPVKKDDSPIPTNGIPLHVTAIAGDGSGTDSRCHAIRFSVEERPGEFISFYGWTFVEIRDDTEKKLNELSDLLNELKRCQDAVEQARRNLPTLEFRG